MAFYLIKKMFTFTKQNVFQGVTGVVTQPVKGESCIKLSSPFLPYTQVQWRKEL